MPSITSSSELLTGPSNHDLAYSIVSDADVISAPYVKLEKDFDATSLLRGQVCTSKNEISR
jgi:hypothetical protein